MTRHLQRISPRFEYPVYFTREVFAPENPDLAEALAREEPARRHRVFVAIDSNVIRAWPSLVDDIGRYARHWKGGMELVAEPLEMPGGEAAKNDTGRLHDLQQRWNDLGMDRQSFVVIVGGGALLDSVGYAAAVTHRGLRVVRVPTTVLAQADSGVGVKNGVNAFGKKNFLGTFAPPFAVLVDERFLETLSRRDTTAGMAEAVKVALIRDAELFGWLEENASSLATGEPESVRQLIRRTAELHLRHIATSGDPFEMGSARPLDFGHWSAHKLEALTANRMRHGEAVAIGIAIDAIYGERIGLCASDSARRVLAILERLGFSLWDDALDRTSPDGRRQILDGLSDFREHLGGDLTITLLRRIGEGVEVGEIREDVVLQAIAALRSRRLSRPTSA